MPLAMTGEKEDTELDFCGCCMVTLYSGSLWAALYPAKMSTEVYYSSKVTVEKKVENLRGTKFGT